VSEPGDFLTYALRLAPKLSMSFVASQAERYYAQVI
jgi:hypothetical protein